VTDAVAAQAIQQTAASVPATLPELKSNNQSADRIRITSVQDAGTVAPPDLMNPNPPPPK
jgi:hypothetical protein